MYNHNLGTRVAFKGKGGYISATNATFSHHVSGQTVLFNYHTICTEILHNLQMLLTVLQASTPTCLELVININLFAISAWSYS